MQPAAALTILLGSRILVSAQAQQQQITPIQLHQAEDMLGDMRDALKKNYYDTTYHGLDIEARYQTYRERLEKSKTLADAFRTVAAYLSGLSDSHTFFLPPRVSYQAVYGYRMQIIGDACYITGVRPETDASAKLHLGDQVLSLDGFSVNRNDLWQLEYYLEDLGPKPASELTIRNPLGEARKEQVLTKYIERKQLKDLTIASSDTDIYNLIFERERMRHSLRSRHVEQGDVMIWKMPAFILTDGEVDHLVNLARQHKALVLDLRDNPGGYVTTLNHMIGSLFDHDVKVNIRVSRKGEKTEVAKSRGKSAFAGDLFVLVDSRSASAAEMFARVVQLEHRGTILGDRTSGSVMEANHFPFSSGMDIKVFYGASVTVADVLMADGKSLEKVGVTPDVILLPTGSQLAEGQDPVLSRAAELAGLKLDPVAAGKLFPYEWAPLAN